MQKLSDFVYELNEARKAKDAEDAPEEQKKIAQKVKAVEKEQELAKNVKPGVPADKNGTGGKWALDEPTDDDCLDNVDWESVEFDANLSELHARFDAASRSRGGDKENHGDFFVIGEAGWGKSSIIKKVAKQYKRTILTVYLDKAVKEDLGGIPVPREDQKSTKVFVDTAMPGWAMVMAENPDKKFLLFFDEMNQADPGVMNALMPIIQDKTICGYQFDNFMVGAAGNFSYENDSVEELSEPLKERLFPIIVWKSGEDQWKHSMKYIHKEWDNVLGKEFVDKYENIAFLFSSPRVLEQKVFQFVEGWCEAKPDAKRKALYKPERILNHLAGVLGRIEEHGRKRQKTLEDLNEVERKALEEVAQYTSQYIIAGGKTAEVEQEKGRSGRKKKGDISMIPDDIKEFLTGGMVNGSMYVPGKENEKYGISRENIYTIFQDEESLNAELIDRFIRMLEADGKKFKYETDDEWRAAGLLDPETFEEE
jgi:MoxR-like ATPase